MFTFIIVWGNYSYEFMKRFFFLNKALNYSKPGSTSLDTFDYIVSFTLSYSLKGNELVNGYLSVQVFCTDSSNAKKLMGY